MYVDATATYIIRKSAKPQSPGHSLFSLGTDDCIGHYNRIIVANKATLINKSETKVLDEFSDTAKSPQWRIYWERGMKLMKT